jgi:hypothetical protein
VVADIGAKHFDDVGFVAGCVVHEPFQGVDTAKADIKVAGAELVDSRPEPVCDLALLSQLLLGAIGGVRIE